MRVRSFAKINLGLEVIRKRPDDYHDLRTLFQSVDLCDILEFIPNYQGEIVLKGKHPGLPWDKRNIIYKAAALLKERFNVSSGVEIHVTKNIPVGGGLGGGSSNAAMTLHSLNTIWGLMRSKEELVDIGKTLGADIPYFLEGGLCLGLGKGDELTQLFELDPFYCVLVFPHLSIITSSVYKRLSTLTSEDKKSKIIKFLDNLEYGSLENGLEETVFFDYPQLREIKRLLYKLGSELSLVSGSGSTVFGLFHQKKKAAEVYNRLKNTYSLSLVKPLSRAQYWDSINVGV
ncbi:4-(cytidine 5'-diphospho)-2-C-methyl-D-erythritol kinase [Acidobacteriota bacterium]